jgi:ketosteroid isomerase-like protein
MADATPTTDATEPRGLVALRHAIDAFNASDYPTFFTLFADDAVYRVAGDNLISGVYRGMEEVVSFFQRLGEVTEGTMEVDVIDALGSHERAVMIFHVTATRQGKKPLDDTGAMAFRLNDEGKLAEAWLLYSNQVAYDEFYS